MNRIQNKLLIYSVFFALLSSCDTGSNASVQLLDSELSMQRPVFIPRAINQSVLFAEMTLSYETDAGLVSTTEVVSQATATGLWEANLFVPVQTDFSLTVTWFDTQDAQGRLNLTTATNQFAGVSESAIIRLSYELTDFDPNGFDNDSDTTHNLQERLDGTSPFDSDDPGRSDDEPTLSAAEIQALENSGAIPTLSRGTSLLGTDANANGVRDDIDQYLQRNYPGLLEQAAARQIAIALQKAIAVDALDNIEVKNIAIEIALADNCIYHVFDGSNGSKPSAQVSQEMESITTNTIERLLSYLSFSQSLDGTSWALPNGDTCE
jgi:hypothetical protein